MAEKPEKKARTTVKRQSKAKAKTKRALVKVPDEYVFWCIDGSIYKDLRELAKGLSGMSNETFYHHVTQEKNDFSNWIRDVINDIELAGTLAKITNREDASTCVITRLEFYK